MKICNMCGLDCKIIELVPQKIDCERKVCTETDQKLHQQAPDLEDGGAMKIVAKGTYHSTPGAGWGALDEAHTYSFVLCEFCLDYLFTQMQITPRVRNINGQTIKFFSAQERIARDTEKERPMTLRFLEEFWNRKVAREK